MKQYNNWEEIDSDTGGLVTALTYSVLFLNDQAYNSSIELYEAIKDTSYYRHGAKKCVNELKRYMEAYNRYVCGVAKVNVDALAVITQSMEDDIKPHIDRYKYAVSQALHNAGCSGDLNNILAISSTIDMLSQTSKITIRDFFTAINKYCPLKYNPLEWLSIDKSMYLSRRVTDYLTPKEVKINLNDMPEISTAFHAIANKMLSADVFERAFGMCEEYKQ